MEKENIYRENSYLDRENYMTCIASQYGVDLMIVTSIAEILGDDEDFDGLISNLEDISII